jgi:AraC-like DNA-binding protein
MLMTVCNTVLNNYDIQKPSVFLSNNLMHSFKVTDTHLRLPSPSLAGCVRAYVSRNTQGADLTPAETLNHYPASPLCTLAWTIEGAGVLVSKGEVQVQQHVAQRVLLMGPHTVPSVTQNVGDVQGLMVFLMPDALQALAGIDVSKLVDTFVPVDQLLDASWQRMADAVLVAPDDVTRIQIIEAFLLPRWQACHASGHRSGSRYLDWMTHLAKRAALSGVGKSTRQIERRVKLWAGLSKQRLRGFARLEASFFDLREASERELLSWAELAFNAGFSDQAHMCREVRRMTGFSPEEIRRAIDTEESFWIYRLWQ